MSIEMCRGFDPGTCAVNVTVNLTLTGFAFHAHRPGYLTKPRVYGNFLVDVVFC